MRNLTTKNHWRYRVGTFFVSCFFTLPPLTAQAEKNDTLSVTIPSLLMGEQKSVTRIQSVSTVQGERLLHRPAFQMEQSLDGTLPGLYVNLTNGYPTERLGLNMRQRGLLIVVDGVPRSDANIPASQIESVSLIKDGLGLAAWGMSSGDGVLYIKTKRGVADKMKIEFTAQYAQAQQIYRPQYLDAATYADLLNRALFNDRASSYEPYVPSSQDLYSQQDIELYRSGESPYTHPDNDWYHILMRNKAPIQQYNLNLSGGNTAARYFIDVNVFSQEGFLKQDKSLNAYNTRENFKKFTMRTNVDVDLTSNTLMSVGLFGQMFRENTPGSPMMGGIYAGISSTPANAYPILNPAFDMNGKGVLVQTFGGNTNYTNNLYAQSISTGYTLYPKTDLNFDIALEHRFDKSLKGLYVKGIYSYNSSYREIRSNSKGFDVYQYTYTDDTKAPNDPSNYTKIVTGELPSTGTSYSRQNRLQYMEAHAGYDFNMELSTFKSRLTYWNNEFALQGGNLPMYKQGFNFHSTYDYDKKYLAEISLSANSLNFLKKGYQWGFFPSAGLGWNIASEDFFHLNDINTLKLRTTLGINGNDGTGSYFRSATGNLSSYYFTYNSLYTPGSNVTLGNNSTSYSTLVEASLPYISQWEKSLRFNIGVDVEAFDKSLVASVEYFNNKHFDILGVNVSKSYSGLLGIAPAPENFGSYRQQGIETNLVWQKQFGDFSVIINPLATIYKRILLENGEPEFPEPYMQYEGRTYGQTHGYIAEGIFQSQAEIDEYMNPTNGGKGYTLDGYIPKPGDIRYKDLNGDYNINATDIDEIYSNAPRIEYGLYLETGWKGFTLSMQWTGLANSQAYICSMPFSKNGTAYGNALKENLDYWTPENPNASYPRLSASDNSYNTRTSTFWVKDNSYLRLKNIEISYTLPQRWVKAIYLSGAKVFANAYNALTVTPLEIRDPELISYGSTVPNFKAYNVGLNVHF
ncbi:MAG: SusC/RagA family TonB-linked outer membrane protein [Paludibacteraceae bacterium]